MPSRFNLTMLWPSVISKALPAIGNSGETVNTTTASPAKPVELAAASEDSRDGSLVYPSYVLIVLMSCYMLSFINRQILALLVAPMKHDLGISDSQVGLLGGAAFAIFYTFAGLPLGRIVDTSSRRNLIAVGIFLWSLMTASCAARGQFLDPLHRPHRRRHRRGHTFSRGVFADRRLFPEEAAGTCLERLLDGDFSRHRSGLHHRRDGG